MGLLAPKGARTEYGNAFRVMGASASLKNHADNSRAIIGEKFIPGTTQELEVKHILNNGMSAVVRWHDVTCAQNVFRFSHQRELMKTIKNSKPRPWVLGSFAIYAGSIHTARQVFEQVKNSENCRELSRGTVKVDTGEIISWTNLDKIRQD